MSSLGVVPRVINNKTEGEEPGHAWVRGMCREEFAQ